MLVLWFLLLVFNKLSIDPSLAGPGENTVIWPIKEAVVAGGRRYISGLVTLKVFITEYVSVTLITVDQDFYYKVNINTFVL